VIQYTLFEHAETPLQINLSRPFVIAGSFADGTEPIFDDATATSGTWAGQPFANLLRNPSAEQIWPHLRPEFQRVLSRVMPRPPAQMLPALFDRGLSWPFLLKTVAPSLLYGVFSRFAWGHIRLEGLPWSLIYQALGLVAIAGAVRWWATRAPRRTGTRPALALLAVAALLVWTNALIWPLPMVEWPRPVVPSTRYVFPAIVPMALLLAGGWWALWPRTYRRSGAIAIACSLLLVNISALWTIWSFYQSVAAGVAGS
jgi:hypothetical protein